MRLRGVLLAAMLVVGSTQEVKTLPDYILVVEQNIHTLCMCIASDALHQMQCTDLVIFSLV